jgi:hypothetical protein
MAWSTTKCAVWFLAAAFAGFAVACGGAPTPSESGGDTQGPMASGGSGGPSPSPSSSGTTSPSQTPVCATGEARTCTRNHTKSTSGENCYQGSQVCTQDLWGPCGDGPSVSNSQVHVFTATCPSSQKVHWTGLSYCVETPTNASGAAGVRFEAVAGGPETWSQDTSLALTVARVPEAGYPTSCTGNDDACSSLIEDRLGSTPDGVTTLTIRADLTNSPDGVLSPTVKSVTALYRCE